MAEIPDFPVTREEMFLNRLVTGEGSVPEPKTREEMYLNAILIGQGGGLPPVTSADNGKIARVVNGAWAAVEEPDVSEIGM